MLSESTSSDQILPLSPMDAVFVGSGSYPIEFCFFYDKTEAFKGFRDNLNKAWHAISDHCPVLKSRLKMQGDRYVFSWDDLSSRPEPINFISLNSSVHADKHQNPYELVDPVRTAPGEPLARLKITEGTDGTSIGFSLSHAIADGFTYFMILGAIAHAANPANAGESLVPMNHDRQQLFNIGLNAKQKKIFGLSKSEPRADISRSSIRYWQKHYSAEQLRVLYQKFMDSPKRLSTNDMICAELWREFTLEFDRDAQENLSLVAPVDYRRIYPNFPKNYAGNAVALSRLDLKRQQVIDMPPVELALHIRQMVQQVDQDYIESTNAGLALELKADDWAGLGNYHIVHPTAGLLITNLSRLSFASLNFGSGAPTYCRPLTPCRRTIVLLSDGREGIIAHIHD